MRLYSTLIELKTGKKATIVVDKTSSRQEKTEKLLILILANAV